MPELDARLREADAALWEWLDACWPATERWLAEVDAGLAVVDAELWALLDEPYR